MGILRKLLLSKPLLVRFCSTITREYNAKPNGNLNINLPFNTIIKPLDVVDYPQSDKVIIKCPEMVNCSMVRDAVNISTTTGKKHQPDVTCEIFAPIKTNINVTCHGHITIADFLGEAVRLYSEHGNITLGNFNTEYVIATTSSGNIRTEGPINASKVELKVLKGGNIKASKLKCLGLHLQTETGTIDTSSSYCEESYFVTRTGEMNLHNVHKQSKILINDNGKLNMIGFNGLLDLVMKKGEANIQISELFGRSSIEIKEKGQLVLKLGDTVVKNSSLFIYSGCCAVEDDLPYEENEEENLVQMKPVEAASSKLYVKALKSVVSVKSGSWAEMIEQRYKENVKSC